MPSIEDGEFATVGGFIIEDDGLEEQLSTGFVLVEDNGIGFAEATIEDCGFCGDSVPSELNYGVLKSEICDFLDFVKEWRAEGGLTDPEDSVLLSVVSANFVTSGRGQLSTAQPPSKMVTTRR